MKARAAQDWSDKMTSVEHKFPAPQGEGTGGLHPPQAFRAASAGATAAPGDSSESPGVISAEEPISTQQRIVHRVFRADLRRPDAGQEKSRADLLGKLRQASWLCAQFGNECLTANYLLFRHRGGEEDAALRQALEAEQLEASGRYRAWGDRLSSFARDAITRAVSGLIKARGREVMRGESSLPTFRRRGAIRVRERGFKLWQENGRLYCSVCVVPGEWIEIELWVKNLHKSPQYQAVLEGLLAGTHKIGQAQVVIVDNYRVSVRILYAARVRAAAGGKVGEIVPTESGIALRVGASIIGFDWDVVDAARHKAAIEARRVQCWRLLRGRRLKRRRARIYRSGTLSRLSRAWMDYQRTWSQQLAAAVAREAKRRGVVRLSVPTAEAFADSFVSTIDFGQLAQAITNACEGAGIAVTQIPSQKEQERELRKKRGAEKAKE